MRSEAPRSTWTSAATAGRATPSSTAAQWHHVALNFANGAPALLLDGKPTPNARHRQSRPRPRRTPHHRRSAPRQAPQRRHRRTPHLQPRPHSRRRRSSRPPRAHPLHPRAGPKPSAPKTRTSASSITSSPATPPPNRAASTPSSMPSKPSSPQTEKEIPTSQGHGRDGQAPRHFRSCPRRLPQPDREGHSRRPHPCCRPCPRTPPRIAWASPSGSSARSIPSPRAWPSIATGSSISAPASSRPPRISAPRATSPSHRDLLDWLATEFINATGT